MSRLVWTLSVCGLVVVMGTPVQAEDLVDLKIELPKEVVGGTPLDYVGENLEERVWGPRKPFKAPEGTTNLSRGKPVTSSLDSTQFGELEQLTDGDKEAWDASLVQLDGGVQWVQVDLGASHAIHAILIWHFHQEERLFFDVIVQVSDDPGFEEGVTTVFNNDHNNTSGLGVGKDQEYVETYQGKLIDAKGVTGRYVRFYSYDSTFDMTNQYIEVEVYGKPVDK